MGLARFSQSRGVDRWYVCRSVLRYLAALGPLGGEVEDRQGGQTATSVCFETVRNGHMASGTVIWHLRSCRW